ncbi:hypothetical protein Dimus_018750 [Dionaea muscipula]
MTASARQRRMRECHDPVLPRATEERHDLVLARATEEIEEETTEALDDAFLERHGPLTARFPRGLDDVSLLRCFRSHIVAHGAYRAIGLTTLDQCYIQGCKPRYEVSMNGVLVRLKAALVSA